MRKTTIYLPDDLKRAITQIARAEGGSEAEVIREAIAERLRRSERPRPRGWLFASGDPDLAANAEEALSGFGER